MSARAQSELLSPGIDLSFALDWSQHQNAIDHFT